jgi:hypothetical protein
MKKCQSVKCKNMSVEENEEMTLANLEAFGDWAKR